MQFFFLILIMPIKLGANVTRRVFLLQKCSVRIIFKLDWKAHSNPIFLNLELIKLFVLVKLRNLFFVHHYLQNKLPPCIYDIFHFNRVNFNINVRSRTQGLPAEHFCNTASFGEYSIESQSIKIWNSTKRVLQIADLSGLSFSKFKSLVRNYMFTIHFDDL